MFCDPVRGIPERGLEPMEEFILRFILRLNSQAHSLAHFLRSRDALLIKLKKLLLIFYYKK